MIGADELLCARSSRNAAVGLAGPSLPASASAVDHPVERAAAPAPSVPAAAARTRHLTSG